MNFQVLHCIITYHQHIESKFLLSTYLFSDGLGFRFWGYVKLNKSDFIELFFRFCHHFGNFHNIQVTFNTKNSCLDAKWAIWRCYQWHSSKSKKILIAKAVNSTFLEFFSEYIGIGPELRKEFKICVEVRISFVPIFIFALNHFFFF